MEWAVNPLGSLSMSYFFSGIDEAGYGPMLGPLVVGLATLHTQNKVSPANPWKLLAPVVSHHARRSKQAKRAIAVADSKKLHRPTPEDLTALEHGVLSFIAQERGSVPATFRELLDHLTAGRRKYLEDYPWYRGADLPIPFSMPTLELEGSIRRLRRRMEGAEMEVAEVRALPLGVVEYNHQLSQHQENKSDVNAWAIGRFLGWLWRQNKRTQADAWIDRLGGRQRYGPILYPLFKGARFQIIEQGETHQEYQVLSRNEERELRIHFKKDGEAESFPTALASMTAKYVRELHMVLFNRWWKQHSPELKRTAGYVQDARRFLKETQALRRQLSIEDGLLIRRR